MENHSPAKALYWIGSSLRDVRAFPKAVRRVMGQARQVDAEERHRSGQAAIQAGQRAQQEPAVAGSGIGSRRET